jgi:hypothetical protein
MMSPDGKYVWDGQQWVPVAGGADAGHRSLFPSWNAAHAEVANAPAAPPPTLFRPKRAQGIVYQPTIADPNAPVETPSWDRTPKGKARWGMYIGAGFLALIVLVVFINTWGPLIVAYFVPAPEPPRVVKPSPTPPDLTVRSDSARASNFLTYSLTPAMTTAAPAFQLFNESCVALTQSCQNAATNALTQVKYVESVVDQAQVPLCAAPQLAKIRADLTGMDAGLTSAVKAFDNNNKGLLAQGLSKYRSANKPLGGDISALSKTIAARCDSQPAGP